MHEGRGAGGICMKLKHGAAVAACILSLLSISSAARADWDIDMTLGTNVALPTSEAPSYIGPRFGLGLRYVFEENHALGIAGRAHILFDDDAQEDLSVALSYRYFMRPNESVNFFVGAFAGVGFWPECVHIDQIDQPIDPTACGGLSGAIGAELGTQIPITEDIAITFGGEFVGRFLASDIKGMMMMPGGWAGVSF